MQELYTRMQQKNTQIKGKTNRAQHFIVMVSIKKISYISHQIGNITIQS